MDFEERRWYVCRDGETCATVARSLSGAYRFDVSIREDDDARLAAQAAQNALDYLRVRVEKPRSRDKHRNRSRNRNQNYRTTA